MNAFDVPVCLSGGNSWENAQRLRSRIYSWTHDLLRSHARWLALTLPLVSERTQSASRFHAWLGNVRGLPNETVTPPTSAPVPDQIAGIVSVALMAGTKRPSIACTPGANPGRAAKPMKSLPLCFESAVQYRTMYRLCAIGFSCRRAFSRNGPLSNMEAFAKAFGKKGDPMVCDQVCKIW
jgi:hypothetical protein